MPPKKKGKGNKLARMTEEEKLRYLQHRAAIEEEARRRKEHVIASYMKNKLKHEEAFTRLNTAKINQQWRQTLRQYKNKELHDASETLRQVFEVALKTKNVIINNLYKDLDDSAKQHALAVQTHLVAVDKILDIRGGRLASLSDKFRVAIDRNVEQGGRDKDRLETAFREDEKVLKSIIACEKTCYDRSHQHLESLGKRHMDGLLHQLMAETKQAEIEGNVKIEGLKKIIKQTGAEYFEQIKPIQDEYIELMTSDDKSALSLMENEKVIKEYNRIMERLKEENNRSVQELRDEIESLKESVDKQKNVHKQLKKSMTEQSKQAADRLNHLARVSNSALDDLKSLHQTVQEIHHFQLIVDKLMTEAEIVQQEGSKLEDEDDIPLGDMTSLWERYGQLQVEVSDYEMEYSNYLEEVSTLKSLLQSSMNTIARPSTVPSSLYRDKMMMKTRSATRCQ